MEDTLQPHEYYTLEDYHRELEEREESEDDRLSQRLKPDEMNMPNPV